MKNECGKCHEMFEVTDNEFFCDKCKPVKKGYHMMPGGKMMKGSKHKGKK